MREFLIWCALVLGVIQVRAEVTGPNQAIESRKNFPGAKDESDLKVQTLRPITRKGSDVEAEDFSSVEPSEEDSSPPAQGFGE